MSDKNYITIEGYERLKTELHNLVTTERPFLVQTIAWAASNGDRSENADYIYGKRKLRELDKQIYRLTKKLENAEVVDCRTHIGNEKVFFGATVTILRNDTIEQIIRIVGQDEINTEFNHISWTSPLARLLIGKSIGDVFKLYLPSGIDEIEIIDVIYI
ncbi:MAG: transcription elongation factor GreB [Burkholderiales bacterium]|jgi:transcription elongation factor GreB|nr:transcription elongation factor GreB [Burkholderiales bacterium]